MRIYIAGPMRGLPDYNFPAFNDAASLLIQLGHIPLNPASTPLGLTPAQYMDIDLAMVRSADALLMLPGWEASRGAAVEWAYARYLDLPIYVAFGDIP